MSADSLIRSHLLGIGLLATVAVLAGCATPDSLRTADGTTHLYPIAGMPPPPYVNHGHQAPAVEPGDASNGAIARPGSVTEAFGANERDDQAEDLPPPPTFRSLADCERAYGPGQCRTGDEIFGQHAPAGTSVPPQIAYSYMPQAYGAMTGALSYGYFAAPGYYVSGVPYQAYLAPVVIQRYRTITPIIVERYRTHPVYIRTPIHERRPFIRDPGHTRPGAHPPRPPRPDLSSRSPTTAPDTRALQGPQPAPGIRPVPRPLAAPDTRAVPGPQPAPGIRPNPRPLAAPDTRPVSGPQPAPDMRTGPRPQPAPDRPRTHRDPRRKDESSTNSR